MRRWHHDAGHLHRSGGGSHASEGNQQHLVIGLNIALGVLVELEGCQVVAGDVIEPGKVSAGSTGQEIGSAAAHKQNLGEAFLLYFFNDLGKCRELISGDGKRFVLSADLSQGIVTFFHFVSFFRKCIIRW